MLIYLAIAAGSALGGMARFWLSGFVAERVGETFPWGTLIVNVTGSFAIGCFATLTGTDGRWLVSPAWRQFFMLGFCGGYTTFSSFSLQTLFLAREGEWFKVFVNVALSLVLNLAAVYVGHVVASSINQPR